MIVPKRPHAALLASPGIGHLIPMVELANRLATDHGFSVTIFVVTMEPGATKSSLFPNLRHNPTQYRVVVLPYVDSSALMESTDKISTRISIMMRGHIPILQSELRSMESNPTLLVVDFFGTEFLSLADEFDMVKYVYIPSTAWFLAQTIYVPSLDKQVKHEGPLNIPGCKPVRYDDLLNPVFDPENRSYDDYVRISLNLGTADGVLLNTWEDLERNTLFALRNNKVLRQLFTKPVYPVGPLVQPVTPERLGGELLEWLDEQPSESVLYMSFGSGGTLSSEQTTELAWGIEASQQRFIWVFRPPIENDGAGALFRALDELNQICEFLPFGFIDRTRELGRVVPMWAPQSEILAHPSVGGFLTHCGWNSTLESLVNGVPIIAWPLYAEQNMNASLLEEEIGVAVRSKVLPSKGIVLREEIEELMRKILVDSNGAKVRRKVKEVQEHAKQALAMEGSSSKSFAQIANDCEMRLMRQKLRQLQLNKGHSWSQNPAIDVIIG